MWYANQSRRRKETEGSGEEKKSKEVNNMIYELKEVHYSLEETQT